MEKCQKCGKMVYETELVLEEYLCDECAEEKKEENKPRYFCQSCLLYIYGKHEKCPVCGEVDEEMFYPLDKWDLVDFWKEGGEEWRP